MSISSMKHSQRLSFKNILRGSTAGALDKAVVIGLQLISIPILTTVWGAEGYGIWVMLLTIPMALALADLGMATAASTKIAQLTTLGKHSAANRLFQSVTGVSFLVSIFIALLLITAALALQATHIEAIIFMTIYGLALIQMNMITAVYRATSHYAFAMTFAAGLLLAEGLSIIIIAHVLGGLLEAACVLAIWRCCALPVFWRLLRTHESWMARWQIKVVRQDISLLLRPSFGALSLTVGQAILLHGFLVVVGLTGSPASAAMFAISRTLSRLPYQLAGILIRPSIPELTKAYARRDHSTAAKITALNLRTSLAMALIFSVLLVWLGPQTIQLISNGTIDAPRTLLLPLGIAASLASLSQAIGAAHLALNQQHLFAKPFCATAIVSAGIMMAAPNDIVTHAAAWAMAICEGCALAFVLLRPPHQQESVYD